MTTRTASRLAIFSAFVLAGCPPRAPPPDLSLDPVELLEQVRASGERSRSVRGEARLKLRGEGGSGSVPAWIAAEKPDRVYVETLDFFGNTVAVLAAADGQLSLYDARERVVYRGPATAESLQRLVPLPLPPAALAEILCGSAPLIEGAAVGAEPGRGSVDLELAGGARTQSLRIGPGARVERSAIRVGGANGRGAYDLAFGYHGSSGFPSEVTLSANAPFVRMELSWNDVEVNAAIDAALFRPAVPRGARVVELGDGPAPAGLFPDEAR